MTKSTLVVEVDCAEDVAALEAWFQRWDGKLAHVSDNQGCGCCVDIFEVEAPAEAIAELPPNIRS